MLITDTEIIRQIRKQTGSDDAGARRLLDAAKRMDVPWQVLEENGGATADMWSNPGKYRYDGSLRKASDPPCPTTNLNGEGALGDDPD